MLASICPNTRPGAQARFTNAAPWCIVPFMLYPSFAIALLLLSPEAPYAPPYVSGALSTDAFETRDPQYLDCIQIIQNDAEIGRIGAEQWTSEGGGPPAQHCLAIAELANGRPRLAGVRLMQLAGRAEAGDEPTRAIVYAEAALAFIDAKLPDFAVEAADASLQLDDANPDLHFVAAKAYAEDQQWQNAISAISRFETSHAMNTEAYIIRARSYRSLLKDDEAAKDVVAALRLEPTNIDALTLRGDLARAGVNIAVRISKAPSTK